MNTEETVQSIENVKPKSQFNPVNPEHGIRYVSDEEYAQMTASKESTPNGEPVKQVGQELTDENKEVKDDTQSPPVFNFETVLKEKTQGKYEKWEDVEKIINKPELPESSKKLFNYLEEGKFQEIETYLANKRVLSGLETMSAEDQVKLKMELDNPELTPDEIDLQFELEYKADIDETNPKADRLKQAQALKLKLAASEAKKVLAKYNDELALPEVSKQLPEEVVQYNQARETITKLGNEWSESLKQNISLFKELDLSINDEDVKLEHKFEIKDSERSDLGAKAQDILAYEKSRYYKDGKYDSNLRLRDIFITENLPQILKSVAKAAKTDGSLNVIKEIANVNTDTTRTPGVNAADAALEAGRKFIRG